jgi:hypothetical protein
MTSLQGAFTSGDGLNQQLNLLLMRAHKRAEDNERAGLENTFVPVYPLNVMLENAEQQIIYGRRGTGKTRSLKHLSGLVSRSEKATS